MAGKMTYVLAIVAVLTSLLALTNSIPAPGAGSGVCSGGGAFYADASDCNAYIQCANGRGIVQHCQPGLQWNAKANVCDWPENSGCVAVLSRGVVPVPAVEEVVEEEEEEEEEEPVPAVEEVVEEEEEEECDDESGDTSKSSGDASTSEESVEGSESSSESVECPADSNERNCPAVDPATSVFFPHSDPNWFYHCSNGVAYCKQCPPGLVWNTNCDTCDWKGQDNCPNSESGDSSKSSGDASTSEESVEGSESSSESVECPADSNERNCPAVDPATSVFFPHSDPHWFYHCSNGVAYCKQCPSGLVWNTNCDTCDWKGQDNCPNIESGDSSKSSGDASTSEESVEGSESSSEE